MTQLDDAREADLADLVRRCWNTEPSKRPTFMQIVPELERMQREELGGNE